MRQLTGGALFILSLGLIGGCCTTVESKPEAPATKPTAAASHTAVMQSGGKDVLRLTLATDVKADAKDGMLQIKGPVYDNEIWLVSGAKTLDDGIAHIDKQIVGEFKDFKATNTTDITIAGAPARRLFGTGHEADDGDAGHADIIVFKVGNNVFIACTHDENLTSLNREGLLTVVATAQQP